MNEPSWLDSISESKAIDLVLYFERKFDWSIPSLWTRNDADALAESMGGSVLSDEEWSSLTSSRGWCKDLSASTEEQLLIMYDLVYGIVLNRTKSKDD